MQHGRPRFDWFGCYQVATVRFVVCKLVCKHLPSGSETEKFNTNRRSRLTKVEVKVVSFMQITNNPDKIMMTIRFLVQQPLAATCQLGLCRTVLIMNCGKIKTFFNKRKKQVDQISALGLENSQLTPPQKKTSSITSIRKGAGVLLCRITKKWLKVTRSSINYMSYPKVLNCRLVPQERRGLPNFLFVNFCVVV